MRSSRIFRCTYQVVSGRTLSSVDAFHVPCPPAVSPLLVFRFPLRVAVASWLSQASLLFVVL